MLNMITHGQPTDKPSLLIVHGLYGSGRNWGAVAKRLSTDRQVICVDQRNHGNSPWYDSHSYADMRDDLMEVLTDLGPCDVLGHSMGGKAAMMLALSNPELVNRLIVADIAPVAYTHTQLPFIHAMKSVDLSHIARRADALEQLEAAGVTDPTLRSFFTQSLDVAAQKWRLNLDVLERDMPAIMGFPDVSGQYDSPTLFLSGAQSDYVTHDHRPTIRTLFPKAAFVRITGAGHWLHAEKPREFVTSVAAWLDRKT